jgi:hypothetical protein
LCSRLYGRKRFIGVAVATIFIDVNDQSFTFVSTPNISGGKCEVRLASESRQSRWLNGLGILMGAHRETLCLVLGNYGYFGDRLDCFCAKRSACASRPLTRPWQRKMLKLRTPQLAMCPASLLQSTKKRFRIERASTLADGRTGGFYAMTRQFRKQGIVD